MSVLKDSSIVEDDVEFTEEQHDIWRSLYSRQFPKIEKYICKEYQQGFKNLQLPADHIPSVTELNARITPRTGWKTVRTRVRYSDAVQWYKHFAAKEFLITDYVRTRDEMEFTPEPDMFHDVFVTCLFLHFQSTRKFRKCLRLPSTKLLLKSSAKI